MKTKGQEIVGDAITIQNLLRLPTYFIRGIRYHIARHFYTPKPLLSIIAVTRRCNSQCIMCSYWKDLNSQSELTPVEIGEVYRNSLFSSLEGIILSGGEPILREDLLDIARAILDSLPQLKQMSLNTNGLEPTLVTQKVKELLALANSKGIRKFSVSVSLDGYGDIHEKIRRVPQAFERTIETIKRLKELQQTTSFYLSSTCR